VSSFPDAPALTVDRARPDDFARLDDFARVAKLTSDVYVGGGLASPEYGEQLRDVAARADRAELLVARDDDGRVVGGVALVLAGDFGEVTESDEEAAFRMLVVDPAVQRRGIGELLVSTCLHRARAAGKRRMVLSTDRRMTTAQRLHQRLGFTGLPERDWRPTPCIDLPVYAREL
jgi:ribosomal protein S18 acetylase RimI-like enzyme